MEVLEQRKHEAILFTFKQVSLYFHYTIINVGLRTNSQILIFGI